VPESWGGDTIVCPIYGAEGDRHRGAPRQRSHRGRARRPACEHDRAGHRSGPRSHLDIGRGPVRPCSCSAAPSASVTRWSPGRRGVAFRALINDHGEQVKEAGPSTPVEVLGLSDVAASVTISSSPPTSAGESPSRRPASVGSAMPVPAVTRASCQRCTPRGHLRPDPEGRGLHAQHRDQGRVHGSLEAVTESLRKLERPEVRIGFVLAASVASPNPTSSSRRRRTPRSSASTAPRSQGREFADAEGVEIRTYEIIYKLLETSSRR